MSVNSVGGHVSFCGHCNQPSEILLSCGRCKRVQYCSKECQKTAYKAHEVFCLNHALIPENNIAVCKLIDRRGTIRDMTQHEFKTELGMIFASTAVFPKSLMRSEDLKLLPNSPIPRIDSIALYDAGEPLGYGVVATKPIAEGEVVCRFGGVVALESNWDCSYRGARYNFKARGYIFDPSKYGSIGEIINDGLLNVSIELQQDPRKYGDTATVPVDLRVKTLRPIEKGEVLRVDYGWQHYMKHGMYVLDESSQRQLLERFPRGLDGDAWERAKSGIQNPIDKLSLLEFEYVIKTPYALAFLYLKADLDPANALKNLTKLKKLRSLDDTSVQRSFIGAESLLICLSKIKDDADKKAQFLEMLNEVTQGSIVEMCRADCIKNASTLPDIGKLKILGKALDAIKVRFFGGLSVDHWDCSDKKEALLATYSDPLKFIKNLQDDRAVYAANFHLPSDLKDLLDKFVKTCMGIMSNRINESISTRLFKAK